MRAKFGGDPTAGSKNLPFKFNNRFDDLNLEFNLKRHYPLWGTSAYFPRGTFFQVASATATSYGLSRGLLGLK